MEKKTVDRFVYSAILLLGVIFLLQGDVAVTGSAVGAGAKASIFFSSIGLACAIIGVIVLFVTERQKNIEELVKAGVPHETVNRTDYWVGRELFHAPVYRRLPDKVKEKVYAEIADVIKNVNAGARVGGTYNLHQLVVVPRQLHIGGIRVLEADAHTLNAQGNQGGRGSDRYLFNATTGEFLGIAYHRGGNPQELRWRTRLRDIPENVQKKKYEPETAKLTRRRN